METSSSQLWYKLIDRLFSRSRRRLGNTVPLKITPDNLCQAGVLSIGSNQDWMLLVNSISLPVKRVAEPGK